jgi:large subunit ribosomal protein L18
VIFMARGKVRIVAHRRRRLGRTDYRSRLGLLRSGKPRLVIRKGLNSMTCQIVKHSPGGDRSLVTASSQHLRKFGWKGSSGNLPGAYLTGLLCGSLAKKQGIDSAVLDIGLHTSTKGSRIYGSLKGALDAGLQIPHSPDILPTVERLRGSHIEKHVQSSGKKSSMSGMFDEVRANIERGRARRAPAKKAPTKAAKTKSPVKAKSKK